jgi:propionyl-CoA carboxylase beta chain
MDVQYNRTIQTLERLRAESTAAGGPDKISRQHAQGKLTARERILLLLDRGSFEEFDVLKTGRGSALGGENRTYLGDGVITGHGNIDGREVFVFSQDFTVIGGSLGEAHSQKICKVMDMAVKVGAPIIQINDKDCLLCSEHDPEFCHRRLAAEHIKTFRPDMAIVHLQ